VAAEMPAVKALTKVKAIVPCGCFVAGTEILTPDGPMPIEQIGVGDVIIAFDQETGEPRQSQVIHLFTRVADTIYVLKIGEDSVETTADHPIWVQDKGWTWAGSLAEGAYLRGPDGSSLRLDGIQAIPISKQVYNFEVNEYDAYFAGDPGIAAHNCNVGKAVTAAAKQSTKYARRAGVKAAWKAEKALVKAGHPGTRAWKPHEVKQLLTKGKVKGYQGHHMKSVSKHPKQAANPKNIKFVKAKGEHLAEHRGNFHNDGIPHPPIDREKMLREFLEKQGK
jgi:hypothetical protein